jgi:RNA recognition motif-containing protein
MKLICYFISIMKFVAFKVGAGQSSSHRGFCFVEFMSPADARRSFDSLVHSTHLYGRRLVLEWAKQAETIDELREKSANKKRWIIFLVFTIFVHPLYIHFLLQSQGRSSEKIEEGFAGSH